LGTYNKKNITKLSKEINIGPSMFLMTVKQLMWLFFFVSVLNIPLYIFFYQINGVGTPRSIIEYFSRFSLTNTERQTVCETMNIASQNEIKLQCPFNTQSQIDELNFIGLA